MWRLSLLVLAAAPALAEPLFEARQFTPSGEYTFGIEGPAVDADGNLYVVNFRRQGRKGKIDLVLSSHCSHVHIGAKFKRHVDR